ncbi:c-type cytochrome [Deinococcus peraridilitoris]|uniref:Cytochrome c biogenesis factor n=1 Tax=Deinococcus peraridilitoris (strain DSM 19664 / LMG 22246 / CIP 109416 / KR-200) TaxID=937777 RepID=K9ZXI6_DEIPD|nr:cytochrome c [Deinococcus peraridilitoris]AFZ66378.1 cytochrome c biogenesis factor [Deinococcus peraridilitoris DSM 19664]
MMLGALLTVLILAALAVLLAPLRRPLVTLPEDSAREALEEDYRASLGALRELDEACARGEVESAAAERERRRLSHRAARTLSALEQLPPAPLAPSCSPLGPALLVLLGVTVLLALGSFTFLPRWQLAGLAPNEAFALRSALRIPDLAREAQRTGKPAAYLAWGQAAFNAARYDEAAQAYAAVLRQNPRQAEALRRLGMLLVQGGDKVEEGVAFVNAGAALDPKNDEGQLFLGFVLSRLGQDEEALKALERYRSLNPQGRDADDLVAAIRARRGSGDEGEATYRQLGCASCHGAEGRGGVGPSLRNSQLDRETSAQVIRRGAASMPAYGEAKLSEAQLRTLLDLLSRWQAERLP